MVYCFFIKDKVIQNIQPRILDIVSKRDSLLKCSYMLDKEVALEKKIAQPRILIVHPQHSKDDG